MKHNFTVMVAEDELPLLNSFCKKIADLDMGFEVIGTAQDGKELLENLKKEVPDLLFTDIEMPQLNGLTLLKELEHTHPNMIKIIVSSYDNFNYAQAAIKLRVHDYLLKPILQEDLKAVLDEVKQLLEERYQNDPIFAATGKELAIDGAVSYMKDYLTKNYASDIQLDELSSALHYNETHLRRSFQQEVGLSPLKYVTHLRMQKAKQLLLQRKDLTVGEIGLAVGYSTPMYFNRIFKLTHGITPGEFRLQKETGE